jgi:hypothetical protein
MNQTVSLFIPDKAHKQILPPHQHKVCAPSETFRTSYPVFSNVVFRKTPGAEQAVSVMYLFLRRIVSNRNCPNLMECRTELDP